MSLTVKIFLFVLILVQVIGKQESNKTAADSTENTLVTDSSKEKEKTDTKEDSRIKKRFLPLDPTNLLSKSTIIPDNVLRKPLSRNEIKLPDLSKAFKGLSMVFSKVQSFLKEIVRAFSVVKLREILFNIKEVINNHKHIEGTPRVFSKDVSTGAGRKLLSAEEDEGEPTTIGKGRSEGQDETGEGKNEEKADEESESNEGKKSSQKKLNRNENPTFENLAPDIIALCKGENCKKDVDEGQKIIKLPKLLPSISGVKNNGIIMAITNPKILKLMQMKRNLKSVKRALGIFETNLARFTAMTSRAYKPSSIDLDLAVGLDTIKLNEAARSKRFILKKILKKNKKVLVNQGNVNTLRLTEKLTASKVYQLTQLLNSYNSESKRIVNDLIILMSNLKAVQTTYGHKKFAPIKFITRLPKTIVHDIPSILIGIIHDILRKIEKLKNTATGGVKSIYRFYDDIQRYLKRFRFNKKNFLYKLVTRDIF